MTPLKIKKGYCPAIEGCPTRDIDASERPQSIAALPELIPFIKPRLSIESGERVKIGSPLFFDKRNPQIKFLSPGGGIVTDINYGPRRVIREIVIALDPQEEQLAFPVLSADELATIERQRLVQLLLDGGLWPLIRALPFRDIADSESIPPMIIVSLGAKEPFQAQPSLYLNNEIDHFLTGIAALDKLAAEQPVYIASDRHDTEILEALPATITHTLEGVYPADDPGVLLYRIKQSAAQNSAWYVAGQDVLRIGQLLNSGRYPIRRMIAVAGSSVVHPRHVLTRLGTPLRQFAPEAVGKDDIRWVAGGLFRGHTTSSDGYLGFYETSLTLLPQGNSREFLALFNPGYRKPTYSRVYLSHLNRSNLACDCNRHGGKRACIACMHCADVCPVDILPQMTYKAILAEEVEEYLNHGLLDCVECGLCSYVCPSKIELCDVFKTAKADYAKEMT